MATFDALTDVRGLLLLAAEKRRAEAHLAQEELQKVILLAEAQGILEAAAIVRLHQAKGTDDT